MKYQITVHGVLDESWNVWLGQPEIASTVAQGLEVTTLQIELPDQPALLGFLNRLADMNLALISVQLCNTTGGYNENQAEQDNCDFSRRSFAAGGGVHRIQDDED